jgi:hypothetical protein
MKYTIECKCTISLTNSEKKILSECFELFTNKSSIPQSVRILFDVSSEFDYRLTFFEIDILMSIIEKSGICITDTKEEASQLFVRLNKEYHDLEIFKKRISSYI